MYISPARHIRDYENSKIPFVCTGLYHKNFRLYRICNKIITIFYWRSGEMRARHLCDTAISKVLFVCTGLYRKKFRLYRICNKVITIFYYGVKGGLAKCEPASTRYYNFKGVIR